MVAIIGITAIIILITIKLAKSTKAECVNIFAKRLLKSSAKTSVRRYCSRKEIMLANEKERMIRQALNSYYSPKVKKPRRVIQSVMPLEDMVEINEPIAEPIMSGASANDSTSQYNDNQRTNKSEHSFEDFEEDENYVFGNEEEFSPSKWWDTNFKNLKQISSEKCMLSKDVLPDESLWPSIGLYVLNEEDYSDYTITEEGILFR